MSSPPPVPAGERTASVLPRDLPACGSESAWRGSGERRALRPWRSPRAGLRQEIGRAMWNASRHGADRAYSTSGACARAGHRRPSGGDAAYRRLHRYPASAAHFRPRGSLDGPPGAVIPQRPRTGLSGPRTWPRPRWCSPPTTRRNLATLNPLLPVGDLLYFWRMLEQ